MTQLREHFCHAFLFIFGVLALNSASADTEPRVLFSDLTAAPKSGWSAAEPDKGAVVTIWGKNFGATRGSSVVTVNGVALSNDGDYAETWGEVNKPTPQLQRVSFWLNSSMSDGPGQISVTVEGSTSNAIPFYINDGRILFVDNKVNGTGSGTHTDPWSDPDDAMSGKRAGDVIYFREGVYDRAYSGGKQVVWIQPDETPGTRTKPIAFVGYPGETALFDSNSNGSSSFHTGFKLEADWYTVAKVSILARSTGIQGKGFVRAVGNDAIGGKVFQAGTGIIVTLRSGSKILGNTMHGGRSGTKLDHALYLSGSPVLEGTEAAFNHIYDNDFDRGPIIVVNHQDNRISSNDFLKSHYIHHNYVDCSSFPSRGIGIYDQSWDGPPETEPEPTYIYNNVLKGCGTSSHPSIYHSDGHAVMYNNTIVDSHGDGIWIQGGILSAKVINNIIALQDSGKSYFSMSYGGSADVTVDNNLYFGAGTYNGEDANAVNADPQVTIRSQGGGLSQNSPAIDNGSSAVSDVVSTDFDSNDRRDGQIDIGSHEFSQSSSSNFPIPNPPSNLFAEPG